MAIRAACFDVGGVVIRISTRWAEMLGRAGLPIPPHVTAETDLSDMPTFDPYQAGDLTDAEYFVNLAEYLGGISIEQAEKVHDSILIEAYPGITELVSKLKSQGIQSGCLSNTNRPHWNQFLHSGRFPAIPAMDVHLASYIIDVSKPDRAAFAAFENAVMKDPSEIVLFDDSAKNCAAAESFGWQTCHIDPIANPSAQIEKALAELELNI